ncbi:hypothetical protein ACW2Q0_28305 [Nocardia sp. R16R-3T]
MSASTTILVVLVVALIWVSWPFMAYHWPTKLDPRDRPTDAESGQVDQ